MLPKSYPYACGDPAAHECGTVHGIFEKQEQLADIRSAREPEIQVWEPAFLVQRVLRGYGREVRRGN